MLGQSGLGGSGSGGAWGRHAREQQQRLDKNKADYERYRQSARQNSQAAPPTYENYLPPLPTKTRTPEEKAELDRKYREYVKEEWDEVFVNLLAVTIFGFMIYLTVQSGAALAWWGHLLFALGIAAASRWMLPKMKTFVRCLRYTVQWTLGLSLLGGILWMCGYFS